MRQYLDLVQRILDEGENRPDRTGTGTRSIFSPQKMDFDLSEGFPLVTAKRTFFRGVVAELLWMLAGETNIRSLVDQGVHIWDEWADENGDLGPIYGAQWRNWLGAERSGTDTEVWVDQIARLMEDLKGDPYSRRHIVSAWNVTELDEMALAPCHCLFQFYVSTDGRLSCQLYQRSADVFLGLPFNIASYSLLTMMIAHVLGLEPGKFHHVIGDAHLYQNHLPQSYEMVKRSPRPKPRIEFSREVESIFEFDPDDILLTGYDPHPHLAGAVAK